MTKRFEKLSETMSPDAQKALSDFLSVSTRRNSGAQDAEDQLQVSVALALRKRIRQS